MCGHTRDPVIYSKFYVNPFKGFGTPGGQNFALTITVSHFYNSLYYCTSRDKFTAKSVGERIFKIGQYLTNVRCKNTVTLFPDTMYVSLVLLAHTHINCCVDPLTICVDICIPRRKQVTFVVLVIIIFLLK